MSAEINPPDRGRNPLQDEDLAPSGIVRVAPTSRISRAQLLLAFAVMIAVGIGVYSVFPESVGGPPLPVTVTLGESPVDTVGGEIAVLTDVVQVTSQLDQPIHHLAIEINDQYLMMQASPLSPGETLVLPQGVFTDKRSSKRFDPSRQQVKEVIVRGQLPSKARGVSRFEFAD
mgnify:CR=1 FL=1